MTAHLGVGIHCFAGGFTMGVKQVAPVACQLEIHNFGRQTCEAHGTKFVNADCWEGWFDAKSTWDGARWCFGNPRCTAFSSFSSGSGSNVRGPTAGCTQDIWDLCKFGVAADLDVISFESVQQARSVGGPLLRRLVDELFAPKYYRVAHLLVNTAAEGCAQLRKRYFFVAYRDNLKFNVYRPALADRATTVGDVLLRFAHRTPQPGKIAGRYSTDYTIDTHAALGPDEQAVIPLLREGQTFNCLGQDEEALRKASPKLYRTWMLRTSGLPFSLHCPMRLCWDKHSPVISSTSGAFIHPRQDRPLTVGEIAALMGWPEGFIPRGLEPVAQIGKGVVPATGAWLAEQVRACIDGDWGEDDFESSYDHRTKQWRGDHTPDKLEKTFNMTYYVPPLLGTKEN